MTINESFQCPQFGALFYYDKNYLGAFFLISLEDKYPVFFKIYCGKDSKAVITICDDLYEQIKLLLSDEWQYITTTKFLQLQKNLQSKNFDENFNFLIN